MCLVEITDSKGLRPEVINHIFLGDVKNNNGVISVTGYHCNRDRYSDTKCETFGRRIVIDAGFGLYKSKVRDKVSKTPKNALSSFFNDGWTRQEIIDCIDNATKFPSPRKYNQLDAFTDPVTGLSVVPVGDTVYPIPRL